MHFHPICQIHLSNESTVITISVDDIQCLKVLPIRYQQIIGEVEVARWMWANVLFCGQFTIGPVTSKNMSWKITSHLDVHILFPLVWSSLTWSCCAHNKHVSGVFTEMFQHVCSNEHVLCVKPCWGGCGERWHLTRLRDVLTVRHISRSASSNANTQISSQSGCLVFCYGVCLKWIECSQNVSLPTVH